MKILFLIGAIIFFYFLFNRKKSTQSTQSNIQIYHGDITKLNIECIVNASNPSGLGCNIPNHCIDSAIHLATGPKLLEECRGLGGVDTGVAKLTGGYNLPAKYVIHCTGPCVTEQTPLDYDMLKQCYVNILNLAKDYGIKEVGFCCISTGLYGYPKKESSKVAYNTVCEWLSNSEYKFNKIVFVTFTEEDRDLYNLLKH
jgi:O-acetyl-ADP-ribose deacetylase (regulator of RNase III)